MPVFAEKSAVEVYFIKELVEKGWRFMPSDEQAKIPLLPLPEQRRIAEILSAIDRKLELERMRKEKLTRIKRGVMKDLLTGKKRVKAE